MINIQQPFILWIEWTLHVHFRWIHFAQYFNLVFAGLEELVGNNFVLGVLDIPEKLLNLAWIWQIEKSRRNVRNKCLRLSNTVTKCVAVFSPPQVSNDFAVSVNCFQSPHWYLTGIKFINIFFFLSRNIHISTAHT